MSGMDLLEVFLPKFDPTEKIADPELVLFYKNLQTRDLWLDTEINWESCSFLIQYIQMLNRLDADDKTPITLHIMSNGGELPTMFSLYNTIKNSKIPIHTVNEGACHSAAFIVFLAGKERRMNQDSCFIAHEGSGVTGGTFRESKAAMKQYELDVSRMKDIISKETKLSLEEIDNHFALESDWYIRKNDAIKYGIVEKED